MKAAIDRTVPEVLVVFEVKTDRSTAILIDVFLEELHGVQIQRILGGRRAEL